MKNNITNKNKFFVYTILSSNNLYQIFIEYLTVLIYFFYQYILLSKYCVMVRQVHHDIRLNIVSALNLFGLSSVLSSLPVGRQGLSYVIPSPSRYDDNHYKKIHSINFFALIKPLVLLIFFSSSLIFSQTQNLDNKFRLAQSYELAGQLEKAESIYRELYQLQPFNSIYFEALTKSLSSQKKYNEAISIIEEKIKNQPYDVSNYGMLGSIYFMKDDLNNAFKTWERGIATNPNSNVVYRVMANYAIENRAFEKAIDFLNRGKKLSIDKYIFSLDLANIYAINMNFENAANEFCELLVTNPEFLPTVKSRISSYISRPQAAEQTIVAINKFLKSTKKIEVFDLLSTIYQQVGEYEKAFEITTKIENDFNGNGSNFYFFAIESLKGKKFEVALKSFKAILDKYKNSSYETSARIGYSKTLEEILNEKSISKDEQWKPIVFPKKIFEDDYINLIRSYEKFINDFENNSYTVEAYYRIAEIYNNRLLNLEKADSLYHFIELKFPYSNFSVLSTINRAKIFIKQNKLEDANLLLNKVLQSPKIDYQNISETNFLLGKINFWKGNFSEAIKLFQQSSQNLQDDFTNDSLENLFIINSAKKDSVNLSKYANAELLLKQKKEEEAIVEFKTLSNNDNLFLINQFANFKLAEIYILKNNFLEAEKILEKLSKNSENPLFSEKSMFLLAQTQKYGEKNFEKAKKTYTQILEFFPNSLYFDRVREELNAISN